MHDTCPTHYSMFCILLVQKKKNKRENNYVSFPFFPPVDLPGDLNSMVKMSNSKLLEVDLKSTESNSIIQLIQPKEGIFMRLF